MSSASSGSVGDNAQAPPCPENEILTRFGPGVSTSDGLSDSSSPFLLFFLFLTVVPILDAFSATVGVELFVTGVVSSCCLSYFSQRQIYQMSRGHHFSIG